MALELTGIVETQLLRKKASHPVLFKLPTICALYKRILTCIERIRLIKYLDFLTQKRPERIALWNGQKLPTITIVEAAKALIIDMWIFSTRSTASYNDDGRHWGQR